MSAEPLVRVDPAVVEAWVRGWALARETPAPVHDHGGFRVDVGWPEQRVRYVFAAPCEGLRKLAASIDEPWVFLKACADADAMGAALPSRWVIQPLGFLMTRDGAVTRQAHSAAGYTLTTEARGPSSVVRLHTPEGVEAAIGRVVHVDEFAIYDRIRTAPGHRRRGLATAVMGKLATMAHAAGARRGLLVATHEGRTLYEALGWRVASPYATAVIPSC